MENGLGDSVRLLEAAGINVYQGHGPAPAKTIAEDSQIFTQAAHLVQELYGRHSGFANLIDHKGTIWGSREVIQDLLAAREKIRIWGESQQSNAKAAYVSRTLYDNLTSVLARLEL